MIPKSGKDFFPRHRVQTCSEAHPTSYPMDIGDPLPWVKRSVSEAHSPYSDWLRAGRSDDTDSIPSGGWEFFSSTPCPDRIWSSPRLLSSGYRGVHSLEVKRPRRVADHSPPSSTEVKEYVELYPHSPISLHGLVLS
jgi:hypothetical protein